MGLTILIEDNRNRHNLFDFDLLFHITICVLFRWSWWNDILLCSICCLWIKFSSSFLVLLYFDKLNYYDDYCHLNRKTSSIECFFEILKQKKTKNILFQNNFVHRNIPKNVVFLLLIFHFFRWFPYKKWNIFCCLQSALSNQLLFINNVNNNKTEKYLDLLYNNICHNLIPIILCTRRKW